MRTFIAVPLDESVRRRVVALQEELAALGPEVKWVEPENLHVTMLFLGEVDAREVPEICRAVRGVTEAMAPFAIEVAGVGCFPNARRPRTLWVGVDEGRESLVTLHDGMEEALQKLGGYRREERGFTPHATLGRIRTQEVSPGIRDRLAAEAEWIGGRQEVREVHVMSSELTADGPNYTVLSREKLRGDERRLE